MFPDNPEINEMINTLKSGFESNQESEIKRDSKILFKKTVKSNSSGNEFKSINKNPIIEKPTPVEKEKNLKKVKLSEEEITSKVEEFKMKQNQILLTKLAEERQKEDDREKAINNARDTAERTKLETQFGIERAQASARIVRYNE
jgi:hypothetical protein